MSDSDSSSYGEGIPSLSALVQSLVPNAPSSDSDDDDDESDIGGVDTIGNLPSSISHLVKNLVQQYDSMSDDDSGNSSSDDDDEKDIKQHIKQATPATTEDDDSDDDAGDAGLSSLVQNILKQRAHRDSVEINSRLSPITRNIPRKKPSLSTQKEEKTPPKAVEPLPLTTHTLTSMASTMDGSQDLLVSSDDDIALGNTIHSVPENEAIAIPLSKKVSDSPVVNKVAPPPSRQRRRSKRASQGSIQKSRDLLNETSHTVISAASTNSAFDPAELESALEKGHTNDDDNTDASSSIPQDSVSSIDEFASSSISTEQSSGRQRKKKLAVSPKRTKSSSTTTSKKSASSSINSSKRTVSSSRRKFDKEPLSPLLGKIVGDSTPGDEMDDILSPLPVQEPLKKKKKKKSDTALKNDSERSGSRSKRSRSSLSDSKKKKSDTVGDTTPRDEMDDILSPLPLQTPLEKKKKSDAALKNDSERSGSRSKRSRSRLSGSKKKKLDTGLQKDSERSASRSSRSRSSLSRSSHKSNKSKSKAKKEKDSSARSKSRRSLISIPETPVSKKNGSRGKRQSQQSQQSSIQETPASKKKRSRAKGKSQQSQQDSIPETPASKKETSKRSRRTPRTDDFASPPITKPRKRRSIDHLILSGRDSNTNPDPPTISDTPGASSKPETSIRSTSKSKKDVSPSKVSPKRATPKRGQSKSPSTKQNKAKDAEGSQPSTARQERESLAGSPMVADPPGEVEGLSPATENDKLSTRRADEEVTDHSRPVHPVGPIHMISFSNINLLKLDEDTSISSSSTEEEDLYETESDEGDIEATEYGSDVSGSQIPASLAPEDSMHRDSVNLPSEAEYETGPADANGDIKNEYEDYESDNSPPVGNFGIENGEGDEYESDNSASFAEDDFVAEEPPKRTGRRTLLQRSSKQTDMSLDDYESDSSDSFVEEYDLEEAQPTRTGRRAMLERSVSSQDLSAVLDEYELDSDSDDEDPVEEPPKRTGRRGMLERSVSSQDLSAVLDEYELDSDSDDEDPVEEPPKRTGRRGMLERSVSSQDLSAVLDEYDLDSDSDNDDPIEEPPKRAGRRGMLERSVSSQDLSAVLDEYDLDSDSDSGNGGHYEAPDSESDDDYESGKNQRNRVPEPDKKKVRESWPAPGSNPRKNLPISDDDSSSVDYTDSGEEDNENQQYEFGSDNEESLEPTQRSNGYGIIDQDDDGSNSFGSNEDFEFDEDYHVIVSSDESSDEDGEYSGGSGGGGSNSNSEDDRNYYSKLDAVTRREDQLALRGQRLRRKIYCAVGTMLVMIIGLVILFIVDPLQKDVLSQGNRRLRGRIMIE